LERALNLIGDRWSLLIVREALSGTRRFGEFHYRLGIAKNLLTTRLRGLVSCGILVTIPAADGSRYSDYVLTPRGARLDRVLEALQYWGTENVAPVAPGRPGRVGLE
jgi:DNA-binding HxlR family transcriptional regulator